MIRQGVYTRKVSILTRSKRRVKRTWRWFKRLSRTKKILLVSAPFLVFLIFTPIITYIYYYNDIGDQERLMNRNNTGVVLTDRNGTTIYSVGRAQHRDIVQLSGISKNVQDALISAEDKDFYKNNGFSPSGILRALFEDVSSGTIAGGGSTITQQLAKNTLLSDNQTILRKYQELTISIAIEQRYTKDQILDMYLNSVFFGGTTFGIQEAAKTYFNESPDQLDLAQSAMLIGILPAPNAYSPTFGNPTYAKERQQYVLGRMLADGYITSAQKDAALNETLTYAPAQAQAVGEAPHFAQMVLQQLYDKYGQEQVIRSGYQAKTTLDLNLQHQLEGTISSHLSYIQHNGGSNVGAVAIDPTSGEVRALVGSVDWNNANWGKVNMATTARQPGSSFKPIYYSDALAKGVITPATILQDVPTDFNGYEPLDADHLFRGNVTVRKAISQSLNIPSVEVMQKLGISEAVSAAQRLGITTLNSNGNYGLSLALGSGEVPLIQMTNAYAALANQGQQYSTTIIQSIEDKYNSNIYTAQETSKQVITSEGAFLMSSILSDNAARAPIFGSSLTVPGKTVAVKTGTTNDDRDAWTIGYTPQLALGVWVGNNDNTQMLNGGSGMAGPIFVNTMKQALMSMPNTGFTVPSGIVQKPVCYSNGGLANSSGGGTYTEYFLASALPDTTCTITKQASSDSNATDNSSQKTEPSSNNTSSGSGDNPNSSTNSSGSSGGETGSGSSGTGGLLNGGTGSGSSTGTGTSGGTGSGSGGTIPPINGVANH